MNIPEAAMQQAGYPDSFNRYQKMLGTVINKEQSTLYVCNTYQFDDYSKYVSKMFREEDKARYRDAHFETDLLNAFNMGVEMVRKLKAKSV